MRAKRWAILSLIMLTTAVFTGCSDDDSNPAEPVQTGIMDTTDKLMDGFIESFTTLDAEGYCDLLDDRYVFYYLGGEDHDYDTEARIIGNMFSGNPPANPAPNSINSGIRAIEISRFETVEPWADVSSSHPDFADVTDAQYGLFRVRLTCIVDDGTITIDGQQIFFAAPADVLVDGEAKTVWRLLGQQDVRNKAGSDQTHWSDLKALFR